MRTLEYSYVYEFYYIYSDIFFFNDTATTEIYTLSLHDALPISEDGDSKADVYMREGSATTLISRAGEGAADSGVHDVGRSEEHTSELQSRQYLVCRLLLEKKNKTHHILCFRYTKLQ